MILRHDVTRASIILAIVTVCHCISGAFAEEISPCNPECQARIKAGFGAAEQLERDGQHELAAQRYSAIIPEEPLSIQAQQAAIRTGRCLEQVNKFIEAIDYYNMAISIANARQGEQSPSKMVLIKQWKHDAMFRRAEAFEKAGQYADAAQAHADMIAEDPQSPAARPVFQRPASQFTVTLSMFELHQHWCIR